MIICGNCNKESDRPNHAKWCKPCAKIKDRESQKTAQVKLRGRFEAFKLALGCSRCGYNRCAASLDFHHRNPDEKERRVSITFHSELSQKEIEKCVLLCKNCHYEEHHNEQRKVGKDDRP